MQEDANNAAQADIVDKLGRKMMDVLNRYARENGLVAVFDSSAQESPILYASSAIDITQEIIKLFDQACPVKATTSPPATKPAPAKSTTPPASKP